MSTEQIVPGSTPQIADGSSHSGGITRMLALLHLRPQESVTGHPPIWIRILAFFSWLGASMAVWQAGELRAYGDALAHELIARRVLDSLNPGFAQLGTVWLPLPALTLVPVVAFGPVWHLGIAGALLGAVYLQLTVGALYRLGYRLGGAIAGGLAVVAFLTNPNTLYLFSIPLTEAPALAFGCLCCAGLAEVLDGFIRGEVEPGALLRTAIAASATLLCRYDGWMLAALAGATIVVAGAIWLRDRPRVEAAALFYAVAPLAAIGLWLFYNWAIFGDPLAFQRGPYSSAAIVHDLAARGIIPTVDGRPPEAGHLLRAATTYFQALLENTGVGPLVLATAGIVLALARSRRYPAGLVLITLAAPLPFYLLALDGGQSVIVTRAADPSGLFNVRYGSALAPCIALGIAALVAPLRRRALYGAAPLAAIALATGVLLLAEPQGPVTVAEGTLQMQSQSASLSRIAARWLAAQPDNGLILIDDALQPQAQTLMTYGERPIRRYVSSSTPEEWRAALQQPPPNIVLIVTLGPYSRDRPNDRVGKALHVTGGIPSFEPAFDNGEIVIFARIGAFGSLVDPTTTPPARQGIDGLRAAALTAPLGIILTFALLGLIGLREAIGADDLRVRRWRLRLNLALVPLLGVWIGVFALHLAVAIPPLLVSPTAALPTTVIASRPDTPTESAVARSASPAHVAATVPVAGAGPIGQSTAVVPPTSTVSPPLSPPPTVPVLPASSQAIMNQVRALRSGHFEARIRYSNANTSTVTVDFDLGDGQQLERLKMRTTYQGVTGEKTNDLIIVGNRMWSRVGGGLWVTNAATQKVAEAITLFLPPVDPPLTAAQEGLDGALHWYSPSRNVDFRLNATPGTGIPLQLEQVSRDNDIRTTVIYQTWNTPVAISPPPQ